MKIAILAARTGWHTDELCRALAVRGHDGHVLPYEALVARLGASGSGGKAGLRPGAGTPSLLEADAVLPRIIPDGSLEQIIYRVDALHWLEARGVPVMNSPRAIERCVDKFYTSALLQDAGLAVPATVVCERAGDALRAIREMLDAGGEVIIKPLFGSMGHGMVRVSDPDVAFRVVRPLEQMRAVFYVQQAIDHGGSDLRVFVLGGRVLGAIERRAPAGEWRTNVARGGAARAAEVNDRIGRAAVAAAAAVGAEYAGVDLLNGPHGELFVLEVNAIPAWRGLQEATGIDVAGALADHLAARVAARRPRAVVETGG
jgi:ribosomal protein S6--L-glutamate ligase